MAAHLSTAELESFHERDWRELAPRLSPGVRGGLEKVLEAGDGGALSPDQQRSLAYSTGEDLLGVLCAADFLRRQLVGDVITYVINRNINFTNICFVGCKFCAFSRGPREA
ncbi:MAG TPA: hypothetical protein VE734_04710, partial [Terriglobales bacterium]|nr:hypothetical protein [Terriglobales bacterium]